MFRGAMEVAEEERDRVRRMAEFRTLLEKRIQKAEAELERLRVFHEFVDAALSKKGLKRVEIAKPVPPPPTPPETAPTKPVELEGALPLKTVTGELLANLYVGEDSVRVVLAEDKAFNVNTPPFTTFFVDKVSEALGVPLKNVIKGLVCFYDNNPVLVVVCGDDRLDLEKVSRILGANVRLGRAKDLKAIDFKMGGVPAVGSGLKTIVDKKVLERGFIVGSAGSSSLE